MTIPNYSQFLSETTNKIKSSRIRELLKLVEKDTDIISFAGGLPAKESFPLELISELPGKAIKKWGPKVVQYGTTEGVEELREAIINYMAKKGVTVDSKDEVLITVGSQQGIYLCGRVLVNPGDEIIVADPTYLAALSVWRERKAALRDVNIDSKGMIMSELERKLKEEPKPKFIYDVPTFSNPSGVTLSLARRKELIELLDKHDTLFIEDDPYSELRYSGKQVPPVKAFDENKRVIYLGTTSKILAPGFRVAWMIAPKELISEFSKAKQSIDLCTPPFCQYIDALYLSESHLSRQVPKIKALYKERMNAMLNAMQDYFPSSVKWTKPQGGMFIWATCPEGIDTNALLDIAIKKEKVAYVPGIDFQVHENKKNSMRLNFSYMPPETIREGIMRLGGLLTKELC